MDTKSKIDDDHHRLAYYTCFLGNDSNWAFLIPPLPSETHDCYFLTNNTTMLQRLNTTKWIPIELDIPIENDNISDCRHTKPIRTCPHRIPELQKYQYLCWLDSKLAVEEEKILFLLKTLEDTGKKIVLSKHVHQFHTVWGEYELALQYAKYYAEKDQYKKYIENKLQSGYSEVLPVHYCGGFTIRDMTDPRVVSFSEEWLENIQECGIEDQISLQFVHPKYADIIYGVDYKWCWRYSYE